MYNVLVIVPHRKDRSPSQRFRFEQYIPFLEDNGFKFIFSYLITESEDKLFYSKGHFIIKVFLLIKYLFLRIFDLFRLHKFDIIFIQRETYFLGPAIFEYLISKIHSKIIYDFDDSIWLPNVSDANKAYDFLKFYSKIGNIIKYSTLIFAGNEYLVDFALRFNNNVKLIPTTVDTDKFFKPAKDLINGENRICIGWSGSITTIKYFDYATGFLCKIKEKYNDKVYFKVIGDNSYVNEQLGIHGIAWSSIDEVFQLSEIDIGIMPLPHDEWTKGKCGLKGLTFMSLSIPVVMSPIGVNSEIITDGKNGFLADTQEEWIDKLSLLIESSELRSEIGNQGRNTVIQKYSVISQKEKYLKEFNNILNLK